MVIENDPPWGVISRAVEPKTWLWYIPGYADIVTIAEAVVLGTYQRAGKKPPPDFKPRPRPWNKKERKLSARVLPIDKFDKWFAGRFTGPGDTENKSGD